MKTLIINSKANGVLEVFYNDEDHELISKYCWHTYRCGHLIYAATNFYLGKVLGKTKQKRMPMHRLLMPGVKLIDHRDGNGLNNCRSNLREANSSQNSANNHSKIRSKTGYRGVYLCKVRKTFYVNVRKNGKLISGGRFKTKELAAKRYNELAIQHFGEFATLNPV